VVSHAFSVLCMYQSSGIILIPLASFVPYFVSFAVPTAELAGGEKIAYSLTELQELKRLALE